MELESTNVEPHSGERAGLLDCPGLSMSLARDGPAHNSCALLCFQEWLFLARISPALHCFALKQVRLMSKLVSHEGNL